MSEETELKPCPWCGFTHDLEVGHGTEDREGWPVYVYCGCCGAHGPWLYAAAPDDKAVAFNQWNTRHNEQ